jgi:hypothetical protein
MPVDIESSFAQPTAALSLACENRGVVAVEKGLLHSRAVCSCEWHGHHLMLAVFVLDAHLHSARN